MPKTLSSPFPLVSVIIRTKDRCHLLKEALHSIVSQTYQHIEVVIVNDGGAKCDGTLQPFKASLDIKTISLPQTMGRSHAANVGLRAVSGEYINFLDDDDILYPNHIEKLLTFLHSSGEQVAYSDCEVGHYQFVDGSGSQLQTEQQPFKGFDFDRHQLYFENYLPIMTVMFASDMAFIEDGFDESLEVFEDWDYWIRLSQHTDFHRLAGITCEYRFFQNYPYDFEKWREVIYQKHSHYWTLERLFKQSWQHINRLELDKLHQQNLLNQLKKRLKETREGYEQSLEEIERNHHRSLQAIQDKSNEVEEALQKLQIEYQQLKSQEQEVHLRYIQVISTFENQATEMQQLKRQNHALEKYANEPGCIIGLYRALLPLTIRLYIHKLRN